MKKSLFLGVVPGAMLLMIAVPALAQSSSASTRPIPSQACVQAMVAQQDAQLANVDAKIASRKQMMQTRRDTLSSISAITDDAQRQEALKKMHEDVMTSRKALTPPESVTTAMENMKTACGDSLGFRAGFHKGFGMGHMMGKRGEMFKGWMNSESSTSTQQ